MDPGISDLKFAQVITEDECRDKRSSSVPNLSVGMGARVSAGNA